MKPLIVLIRIIIIGCFWSVFFLEGIRVIMLRNWRFDIISYEHWQYAWDLWMSGWVISDAKEWAFVLIIVTFIPLWLTGWAALSLVAWENIVTAIVMYPVNLFRKIFHKQLIGIRKIKNAAKPIKRKPSYKEVRPRGTHPISEEPGRVETALEKHSAKKTPSLKQSKNIIAESPIKASNVFEHSLLSMENEDDDFVFNFDAFDTEVKEDSKNKENNRDSNKDKYKSTDKNSRKPSREREVESSRDNRDNRGGKNKDRDSFRESNRDSSRDKKDNNKNKPIKNKDRNETANKPGAGNIIDIIKQKGYEVVSGSTIKNNLIDFIGVSKEKICICLLDREPGDWLADEERFNDEEPLWFSESSHRISPVRKIDMSRKHLETLINNEDLKMKVEAYVIIQLGNIINAEDMLDIWNDMDIHVTRIDRGSPKDIILFTKALPEAEKTISDREFEKVKKIIRG